MALDLAISQPRDALHDHGHEDVLNCFVGVKGALDMSSLSRDFSSIGDEGTLVVTVGGSVSGVIDVDGDVDTITVDLVAGQRYSFSLRGTGATPVEDTFLEVFGTDGTTLISADDDGGNTTNSMLTFTAAATGTYTIEAAAFDDARDLTGGWTLDVRQQGADESTAVGNAVAINVDDQVFGFTNTLGDNDYFAVTLEAGTFYTFKVAGGADGETSFTTLNNEVDTRLYLYAPNGTTQLAFNDDINGLVDPSSAFSYSVSTTGTYYLRINPWTDSANGTGGYILEVNEINPDDYNPLDAIHWVSANTVPFVDVGGTDTAYVYFGAAGETFGEPGPSLGWSAAEKAAVMLALGEFSEILGVNYVETAVLGQATFRLITTTSTQFGAYMYPQDPAYGAQQGIAAFNVNSGGWASVPGSLQQGGFAFGVILHEFGHGHGLAHPHDTGGGSEVMLGVTASQGSYGLFSLNQGVYTVMSYNDGWKTHPDGVRSFSAANAPFGWSGSLSAFDIAMLQQKYGVLNPNEAGDSVYTLSDVNAPGSYYECIWDSGGEDRIEYNGVKDCVIDLTAATLDYSATGAGVVSFVDTIFAGFTIANGVVIENAVGGGGNDMLIGNEAANRLYGGGGNDTMIGRNGASGRDNYRGGNGDDSFYVDGLDADHAKKIRDFGDGGDADVVLLEADSYGLAPGALDPNIFVVGTAAGDADDRFIYNDANGKLFFDADGNGAGAKVLIARFENLATLDATDFAVI
ncbi:MAG: pre-peptidase C-terminal domain-containing protein [Sphingomonadaceae bacterium]|nr:pre-peptidase C-terminal domain-containing protein [Sphingomonadaceae bacterium]